MSLTLDGRSTEVGRARKVLATVMTVAAALAYFFMMAMSEYRYLDLVFWTVILAAPILFAVGPRKGLLRRLGFGFAWMVSATFLTMIAVMVAIFAAVAFGG